MVYTSGGRLITFYLDRKNISFELLWYLKLFRTLLSRIVSEHYKTMYHLMEAPVMGFHLWAQTAISLLLQLVIHGNLHLRRIQNVLFCSKMHIFSLFSNIEVGDTHSNSRIEMIRANFSCRTPCILWSRRKKSHHLKLGRGVGCGMMSIKSLLKFKYVTEGKWHTKPSIIIFIITDIY